MENNKIFADGIIFQDPNEKAPDFIKFDLVIHPEKFAEFMKKNLEYTTPKGWMKIVAKESKKTGGIYFELDTYKPKPKEDKSSMTSQQPDGSDPIDTSGIPF